MNEATQKLFDQSAVVVASTNLITWSLIGAAEQSRLARQFFIRGAFVVRTA